MKQSEASFNGWCRNCCKSNYCYPISTSSLSAIIHLTSFYGLQSGVETLLTNWTRRRLVLQRYNAGIKLIPQAYQ